MEVSIYVLIDPTTSCIRYVGRTSRTLTQRLNGHLSKARRGKTHKDCWIRSLLNIGLRPHIKLFKTVTGWTNSYIYERQLIVKCLSNGYDLVNNDDRGEGSKNKIITDECKRKISETLKLGYKEGTIKRTHLTSISVFDLQGNFIQSFDSLVSCTNHIHIPQSSLEKVLAKRCRRWKNFQITYGTNPGPYKVTIKDMSFLNKKVNLLDLTTNTIINFDSYKSLALYLNTSKTQVRRYVESGKIYKENYIIQCPNKIG